jgi:hypothetical protein
MKVTDEQVAAARLICEQLHQSNVWDRFAKGMAKNTTNHERLLLYVNYLHDGLTWGTWPKGN